MKQKWNIAMWFILTPIIAIVIEEIAWNEHLLHIKPVGMLCAYIICLLIELLLWFIIQIPKVALVGTVVFAWIFGMANYFVLLFRGNAFTASDLFVARTAFDVADQYTYTLGIQQIIALAILIVCIGIICRFSIKYNRKEFKKRVITFIAGSIGTILVVGVLYNFNLFQKMGMYIEAWSAAESYAEETAITGFWLTVKNMQVEKPSGYDEDYVKDILARYKDQNTDNRNTQKPSVIVIMNESFSDLHVVGDFEAEDYMKAYNDIDDYYMKGKLYSSVLGGSTCNSEFEFLTGNSMAGFGGFPYQQFDLSNCKSYVDTFKENGYQTIAYHPFNPENYNRNKVYPLLGFDDFVHDIDDTETIAWASSDRADYNKVIGLFENKTGPLFLFNVTMQNHGGYTDDYESLNVDKPVEVGEEYKECGQAITYLTLMRESSEAFSNLIEYFRNVDEPVIVVIFGDHQPFLEDGFFEKIYEDGDSADRFAKRYTTEYMIWSNYYTGEPKEKDLSINYLVANLMSAINMDDEYINYMLDIEETVPAITGWGYLDANNEWHFRKEENALIDEYKQVEYYEFKNGK